MIDQAFIRNFCIIAHVDHGKTTLSDRFLERTGAFPDGVQQEQVLDSMDLEREKGITIKAHPVTMYYIASDGIEYEFNLIDTPGHVDFSYEVSRSLSACEGAILVVDATQGVEAQTVANYQLALKCSLAVIPVINKIDLPHADINRVKRQLEDVLAIPSEEVILASAKEGVGIDEILEAIVKRIPPPSGSPDAPLQALVFDSYYDPYKGVVCYVRVKQGVLRAGIQAKFIYGDKIVEIKEVGSFNPRPYQRDCLVAGETGYFVSTLRSPEDLKVGDTLTDPKNPAPPLPGFQEIRPMVFSGVYPVDSDDFERLKSSLAKLHLNDPAFVYQPESSAALGFGFRCGFLGFLHMEIVQERLRREYDIDVIYTYPSVVYKIKLKDGREVEIDNPVHLPPMNLIEQIFEPIVNAFIITPTDSLGEVLTLIKEKRGEVLHTETIDFTKLILKCKLPLSEILVDFHDRLKSITHGYGSMDYEHAGYEASDLVKLDILVNGKPVDAFSCIVHRSKAESRGRAIAAKLKEVIPRQLFEVAIQAAIGSRIIARETIKPYRKDVTAKCYGGDVTRKRKLLERQKEGKKRMKAIGEVRIPQDAFLKVLKVGSE